MKGYFATVFAAKETKLSEVHEEAMQNRHAVPKLTQQQFDPTLLASMLTTGAHLTATNQYKAFGEDLIAAPLLKKFGLRMAQLFLPIYWKSILFLQWPIQWTGGCLADAYKGKGSKLRREQKHAADQAEIQKPSQGS